MVAGKLFWFNRDPMFPKKDRGRGWYYQRTEKSLRRKFGVRVYWSKYTPSSDATQFHRRKTKRPIKNIEDKELKYPHLADYKTKSSMKRTPKVRRVSPEKAREDEPRGYY